MSTALIRIEGTTYKQGDLSRVSALVLFRAAEELSTLGLRTTWEDLTAILKRTTLPDQEWTTTEQVWLKVLTAWMTLNAYGTECSLYDAMGMTDVEIIAVPEDHQGKAPAPKARQGSGRGAASHGHAAKKTRSSSKS